MKPDAKGQSLAEIVVSIGVVALLVTGVIVATTSSLRNSQAGRVRSLAIQAAQEGAELARDLRNQSWSEFLASEGEWCVEKDGVWSAAAEDCPFSIDNTFARTITLSWDTLHERMIVVVVVSWMESGEVRQTTIETYMTNWR